MGPAWSVTPPDYEICLDLLKADGVLIDYTFEKDSNNKIHLHAVWQCKRKNPFIKRYTLPLFNLDIRGVYDKQGVIDYIHKAEERIDDAVILMQMEYMIKKAWLEATHGVMKAKSLSFDEHVEGPYM